VNDALGKRYLPEASIIQGRRTAIMSMFKNIMANEMVRRSGTMRSVIARTF
jgi:hypothetical protein